MRNYKIFLYCYSGAAIRQHFILTKAVPGPTKTRDGHGTDSVSFKLIITML